MSNKQEKFYVVADPHGFYTYMRQALEEKGFFEEENKKLIVCGDILDRGQEAEEMVEFLLEEKEKGELIFIAGNHEDLFMQALQEIASGGVFDIACGVSHHYTNGTWDTLLQLAKMEPKEAVRFPFELVRRIRQSRFYKELLPFAIDYYETKQYIFCHGWLPSTTIGRRPSVSYRYRPDWREASVEDWKTARWFNGIDLCWRYGVREPGKTVVCGHWHCSYGHAKIERRGGEFGESADFSPFYEEGLIAIDACTSASQTVNCIVLTDETL